jgi:hypothetical protein
MNRQERNPPLGGLHSLTTDNALLLPGALLMAMRAQLLAALMFIDLCFSALFQ